MAKIKRYLKAALTGQRFKFIMVRRRRQTNGILIFTFECVSPFRIAIWNQWTIWMVTSKKLYIHRNGICLFRAISVLMFGHEKHHNRIRQRVVEYMVIACCLLFLGYCITNSTSQFTWANFVVPRQQAHYSFDELLAMHDNGFAERNLLRTFVVKILEDHR